MAERAVEAALQREDMKLNKNLPHFNALLVTCSAFWRGQRKEVGKVVGGVGEFLGFKRSWDETPCKLWANSAPQFWDIVKALGVPEDVLAPLARKRLGAVFQVMQQRAAISTGSGYTPIYIPARVVASTCASNLVAAMEDTLPECKFANIQAASKKFDWVMYGTMCDHAAPNRATQACCAAEMPDALLDEGRCCLHQNHICFKATTRPWELTGSLHALGTGFHNSTNQKKLFQSLCLLSRRTRIWYRAPPPEAAAYRSWLLDLTLTRFAGEDLITDDKQKRGIKEKLQSILERVGKILNGRYWIGRVEHYCHTEGSGVPCCKSPAETFMKATLLECAFILFDLLSRCISTCVCDCMNECNDSEPKINEIFSEVCALIFDPKYISSDHDWFKTTRAAKPWTFGIACHGFILSALRQICPLTAEDTEEALRDREGDSTAQFFAKRLKRGVKKLAEPKTCQELLSMMTITQDVFVCVSFSVVRLVDCEFLLSVASFRFC